MEYTKQLRCGCVIRRADTNFDFWVDFCPLHKSAPDLYEAAHEIAGIMFLSCSMNYLWKHNLSLPLNRLQKALIKAEGANK